MIAGVPEGFTADSTAGAAVARDLASLAVVPVGDTSPLTVLGPVQTEFQHIYKLGETGTKYAWLASYEWY